MENETMNNESVTQSSTKKEGKLPSKLIIIAAGCLVAGFILSFLMFGSAGTSNPVSIINSLEKAIESRSPGSQGKVLASVDGDPIHQKLFDLQLDFLLKYSAGQLSSKQQLMRKNSPEYLRKFLNKMISIKLIINDIQSDSKFKNDTKFLIFVYSSLLEAVQKYYMHTRVSPENNMSIDTKISEKEIAAYYNKLRKDPKYRNVVAKTPFKKLRQVIERQIIQRRQQQALLIIMDKLKSQSKIIYKDDAFKSTSSLKKNK